MEGRKLLLRGPRFAQVSYTLFAVAVLLALLKLGGISGAKPLFLKTVPPTPVVKAAEAAATERKAPEDETLDLPDAEGFAEPARRLLTGLTDEPVVEKGDPPVFYRPSGGSGEPVCGNLGDLPGSSRAVFPLPRDYFDSYDDTWGAARSQGRHEGTDLMGPTGTPEFAITDGTLVPVVRSNENGWNRLGGYTVMLEVAYDVGPIKRGDLFYYAHMDRKSALPVGTKVRAGQQIGLVGDTGEGREGTRGKFPPHLHLGWYDASGDRTDLESGAMNPYPLLLWLEEYGGVVTGGTDVAYCEAPQEPIPSTGGEDHRHTPGSSGTNPDLDTGDRYDVRPSPIVEKSRTRHVSPERENGPDEERKPRERDERTGGEGEDPKAKPAGGSERDNGTGDGDGRDAPGEDETGAREDRASGSSGAGGPAWEIRERIRLLADTLREAAKKDRNEQDDDTTDKKKHKKKKSPDPPGRERPEKERTSAGTARPQPDPANAPTPEKDSKTAGPEEQTPEEVPEKDQR